VLFPSLTGPISSVGGSSLLLGGYGSCWGQVGLSFLVWGSIAYCRAISVRGSKNIIVGLYYHHCGGDFPLGIHCVEVLGSLFISGVGFPFPGRIK
jgi:hypothetical protein